LRDVRFGDPDRPEANPYVRTHREFGRPLLPADQAATFLGRWQDAFGQDAPLHLEIGSGNGFFLSGLAKQHPDWNVLGIEIRYKRVEICATKIRKLNLTNALIARYDAWYLDDLILPGELHGLYVNHPDPWARHRWEKYRLISRWFLEAAALYLRPGAWLRVKSDWRDNVDRIPRLLSHDADKQPAHPLPFRVAGYAEDITRGPAPWPDDIETNYQSKFRKRGLPVYAIELIRTEAPFPPEGWVAPWVAFDHEVKGPEPGLPLADER
jgi:tRNA (guanine-N7-)-methyltransferase